MPPKSPSRARHILFLTPQVPYPPQQGTALRNWHLLRAVSQVHEVSLLTFAEHPRPPALPTELTRLCQYVQCVPAPPVTPGSRMRALFTTTRPDLASRLRSQAFYRALDDLLARMPVDVVQIEGLELAAYMAAFTRGRHSGPAVVLDDHNAEYLLQRRALMADVRIPARWPAALYSLVQWWRLERFERWACEQADAVVAVSDADARALGRLVPSLRPTIVPNGVDVSTYRPGLPDTLDLPKPTVVFTGKMDYRPNVDAVLWFHSNAWPAIRRAIPRARLYIVGRSPHRRLRPLRDDPSVCVTGYVPDDLPYFAAADVYVAPLRVGGGTRLKILQALAAGLPLVSTSLGAEGLDIRHGEHALLAEDGPDFAEAVIRLLRDRALAQRLGRAGRELVLATYCWDRITPRLLALYDQLLA